MEVGKQFRESPAMRLVVLFTLFFFFLLISGGIGALLSEIDIFSERVRLLGASVVQCLVAFCVPAWLTARFASSKPYRFTGLSERVNWRPFVGVILVFFLALPAMNQLILWNQNMHFPEFAQGLEQTLRSWEEMNGSVAEKLLSGNGVGGMIVCVLIVGVLTGFSEEIFFRGSMQRIFGETSIKNWMAVWSVALIFSAMHFQFFGFVPRVLMGVFFGYLFLWTGSLWPSVFAHALNNSIVVVAAWLAENNDIDTLENFGVAEAGEWPVAAISSAIATFLFFKIFRKCFFFNSDNSSESIDSL